MTQEIIYPYGTADVTVPIGQYVLIAALEGKANIYVGTDLANYPPSFEFDATIENEQVTYGTYSVSTQIRINAKAGKVYYDVGASPSISLPAPSAVAASSNPYTIDGLDDTQGGAVNITGGTSSTSANAGGAVAITGGTPGATGVGGAASMTGGAGGATSGAGGAVSAIGGAGTGVGAAGGAASMTGGAAVAHTTGTGGAGGAASLISAAGASATGAAGIGGAGGAVAITAGNGGAATDGASGDGGAGGTVTITAGTGGASTGATAGANGNIINRGVIFKTQGAPTAKTDAATLTGAELLTQMITINTGAAGNKALTLPTGTDMSAAAPNAAVGDSFDFSVINISTTAGDTGTVTANTDHTLVGNGVVSDIGTTTNATSGVFRCRKTAATTWICYRVG